MTGERTWLDGIKARRRRQYLGAFAFLLVAELAWLGAVALSIWAWVAVFHHLPPSDVVLKLLVGLGSLIVMPLAAIGPLAPMKGPDPEVIAADEFFRRDADQLGLSFPLEGGGPGWGSRQAASGIGA